MKTEEKRGDKDIYRNKLKQILNIKTIMKKTMKKLLVIVMALSFNSLSQTVSHT